MKSFPLKMILCAASATMLATMPIQASEQDVVVTESEEGKVKIEWLEPKSFADVRRSNGMSNSKKYRDSVFKKLQQHFDDLSDDLPDGYRLNIQVTDLDMAGDTRAGMAMFDDPNMYDVRVMRRIDIPRMKFTYELMDETGNVVRSQEVKLKDMDYLDGMRSTRSDRPLYYEKKC